MNPSQRRVCFAANTKTHDGKSPAAQYFEDFIAHVKTFEVFTERDLIVFLQSMPNRLKLLPSLVRQLHRLVTKLGTTSRKYVRILPVTKTKKLPASYFQWSVQLYNLLVRLCRRFNAVLKNALSSTSSAVHSKRKRNAIETQDTRKAYPSTVHPKRKRSMIETQYQWPNYPSTAHSKREQHVIATQGIKCC